MLYYVIHDPSRIQIFDSSWTNAKAIFHDIDKIKELYDIDNIHELTICGGKYSFKITNDLLGYPQLSLAGRHFYMNIAYGRTFIMPKQVSDKPIQVHTVEELDKLIGQNHDSCL